jgi:hypothetical protein
VRQEGLEHSRMGTFRVVVEEHQHAAYGRSPWRGPAGPGRWVRVVAVPPNVTRQRGGGPDGHQPWARVERVERS